MKTAMKLIGVLLVLSLAMTTHLAQATKLHGTFKSTETQASLIELYSSEGCYSCPPADAWLRKLKTDARLWKEYVPIAFHVDYWDYIGWKDTFATAAYTQRQRDYASHNRSRSVYTPEFFINGSEWRGFFKKKNLPIVGDKLAGYLSINIENNKAHVIFAPPANTSFSYDINIAVLGFDLVSNITNGENEGKTLHHDFIALGHKAKPLTRKNKNSFQVTTDLPMYHKVSNRLGLAAWVTRHNSPVPIQAVGGWLD